MEVMDSVTVALPITAWTRLNDAEIAVAQGPSVKIINLLLLGEEDETFSDKFTKHSRTLTAMHVLNSEGFISADESG